MPNIFISYAREDTEFVKLLVDTLTAEKRDVWVDFQDIPFATDWWEKIQDGIDASEAIVFVISPDSLASRYCGLEVNYAVKNNKRLIPVVYREPDSVDPPVQPPKEVSALNWIFFKDPAAFNQSLRQLLETVDTDQELLEQHTRLLILARDWEKNGHNRSFLLRGAELDELDDMLEQSTNLTDLQREFLLQSQQQQRRLDVFWRFGLGFLGGFLGVGFWAFSVFRSEQLITPLRFIYTSSLGQVFGIFIGLLCVLAGDLSFVMQNRFSRPILLLRVAICLVIGFAAWAVFRWLYLQEGSQWSPPVVNMLLFSGLGLAFGFVVRVLFNKLPGWVATVITAIAIFIPMYMTFVWYQAGDPTFEPLIFFDNVPQLLSVGIPMVILIALGANAQSMRKEIRNLFHRPSKVKT